MTSAGWRSPFEVPVVVLGDLPSAMVFQRVMAATEVCQVPSGGFAAVLRIDRVVEITSVRGNTAAGEAAVLISRREESSHCFARPVPVDRHDRASGRVDVHLIDMGGPSDEETGGVRVDGAVPGEFRGDPANLFTVATAATAVPEVQALGEVPVLVDRDRVIHDLERNDDLDVRGDASEPTARTDPARIAGVFFDLIWISLQK